MESPNLEPYLRQITSDGDSKKFNSTAYQLKLNGLGEQTIGTLKRCMEPLVNRPDQLEQVLGLICDDIPHSPAQGHRVLAIPSPLRQGGPHPR